MIPLLLSIICELWRKKAPGSSFRVVGINHATEGDVAGLFRFHFIALLIVVLQLSSAAVSAQGNISNEKIPFDIPRQRADLALIEFAEQADVTFIFPFDEARQKTANRVVGDYTRDEAIKILLETAGLEGSINQNGVLTVSVTGDGESGRLERGEEMNNNQGFFAKLTAILVAATTVPVSEPASAQGLALEEVVVTAQRREESLQEVPISISVYSGEDLELQGYRNLEDLSKYTASVTVLDSIRNAPNVTIRGFGTAGNSLTSQAAAPFFVDGIHFGSPAMVKNAFLDTERVEVLKGPQPLHFGMNATAGAFNIQSRRPTAEWEGDIAFEIANDGKEEVTAAFGGPLTNTLGIRVAGIYEDSAGPVTRLFDGIRYPARSNLGGRVSLEWTPNDRLNVFGKFDITKARSRGSDLIIGCLAEGRAAGFVRRSPLDGLVDEDADIGNPSAVLAPPPKGVTGGVDESYLNPDGRSLEEETGTDCFDGDYGLGGGGPYIAPPENISGPAGFSIEQGSIDTRRLANAYLSQDGPNGPGPGGTEAFGIEDGDHTDSWNAVLDITYEFANGINLNSQTGAVRFRNTGCRTSEMSTVFGNHGCREEAAEQYSQQFRVESPVAGYDLNVGIPGGVNLDFMAGAFWQTSKKNIFSIFHESFNRPQRYNTIWEDSNWFAGFWNLTFNLMDKQLSISAGGRYTDISKDAFFRGYGSQFIFDEAPCNADPAANPTQDDNPASCPRDPDFKMVHPDLTEFTVVDPVTGNGGLDPANSLGPSNLVRVDSPHFLLPDADLDNLWAPNGYFTRRTPSTLVVPLNWRSPDGPQAVGFTGPVYSNRNGPFGPCGVCIEPVALEADNYDSQFVISFTPNALDGNHTFYGKYVSAFKGPVPDTGTSTLPSSLDSVIFAPEYAEAWEAGARGVFLDGRLRYDVTVFTNEFTDLQTDAATPFFNPALDRSVSLNAGKQTVDGLEFSIQAAATQNLTINFAGAFMDAEFGDFDGGGCSEDELIAAMIDATTPTSEGGSLENRSAEEIAFAESSLDGMGANRRANLPPRSQVPESYFHNGGCRLADTAEFAAGETSTGGRETIDRSGQRPPFTPDWKFVLGATYTRPVMENFEMFFNATGFIESERLLSIETREMTFRSGHKDLNLAAGFGPRDGSWRLIGFMRNMLEDRPSFNPEYELEQKGIFANSGQVGGVDGAIGESSFRSYGVRFEYFYR